MVRGNVAKFGQENLLGFALTKEKRTRSNQSLVSSGPVILLVACGGEERRIAPAAAPAAAITQWDEVVVRGAVRERSPRSSAA